MRFPLVQTVYADVPGLIHNINRVIVNPLIIFLFSAAVLYFLYGLFMFLSQPDNEAARGDGKRHMIYGILGMFIMMAVFTIMQILINTFDIRGVDVRSGEVNL